MECMWLPDYYEQPDWNNYIVFEENLYFLFRKLYLDNPLVFHDQFVRYRHHPKINDKEEIFYHLTCKTNDFDGDRSPDPNRIIRIKWARSFIENHICLNECCKSKPFYWTKLDGNKLKHKIFFEDYLVILEERDDYFLLITGFYVEEEYYKRGLLKEFMKAKSATKK